MVQIPNHLQNYINIILVICLVIDSVGDIFCQSTQKNDFHAPHHKLELEFVMPMLKSHQSEFFILISTCFSISKFRGVKVARQDF